MTIILTLSGDVELNPGPDSVEGDTDSSYNYSFEVLANHLSILHLNVQSLLPKLDFMAAESETYDVLVFLESWLKPTVKSDTVSLSNFHPPFRTDRPDQPGGGVMIFVRDSIYCKRRNGHEVQGRPTIKTYSRRIWNYKLADFDFRDLLTDYNLAAKVEETTDLDTNAQQITDVLLFCSRSIY